MTGGIGRPKVDEAGERPARLDVDDLDRELERDAQAVLGDVGPHGDVGDEVGPCRREATDRSKQAQVSGRVSLPG